MISVDEYYRALKKALRTYVRDNNNKFSHAKGFIIYQLVAYIGPTDPICNKILLKNFDSYHLVIVQNNNIKVVFNQLMIKYNLM